MKLDIIHYVLLCCLLAFLVGYTHRCEPKQERPSRVFIDTLAEKRLELHPAIDLAWVEYDSTYHEWWGWIVNNESEDTHREMLRRKQGGREDLLRLLEEHANKSN